MKVEILIQIVSLANFREPNASPFALPGAGVRKGDKRKLGLGQTWNEGKESREC